MQTSCDKCNSKNHCRIFLCYNLLEHFGLLNFNPKYRLYYFTNFCNLGSLYPCIFQGNTSSLQGTTRTHHLHPFLLGKKSWPGWNQIPFLSSKIQYIFKAHSCCMVQVCKYPISGLDTQQPFFLFCFILDLADYWCFLQIFELEQLTKLKKHFSEKL